MQQPHVKHCMRQGCWLCLRPVDTPRLFVLAKAAVKSHRRPIAMNHSLTRGQRARAARSDVLATAASRQVMFTWGSQTGHITDRRVQASLKRSAGHVTDSSADARSYIRDCCYSCRDDERASVSVSGDVAGAEGCARWATSAAWHPPSRAEPSARGDSVSAAGRTKDQLACSLLPRPPSVSTWLHHNIQHLSISLFLPVKSSSYSFSGCGVHWLPRGCCKSSITDCHTLINITFRLPMSAMSST